MPLVINGRVCLLVTIEVSSCGQRAAVDHCGVMTIIRGGGRIFQYIPWNWNYLTFNFSPEVFGIFAGLGKMVAILVQHFADRKCQK
jgi:hypothetical protein